MTAPPELRPAGQRVALPIIIATVLVAAFLWLGFWQLRRLEQRRARVRDISERVAAAPRAIGTESPLPRRYERVVMQGTLDYANEIVVTGRTRHGSPGVHLLTPLRLGGRDTAVLVNRGWVYSPDASQVQADEWDEPNLNVVEGWGDTIPEGIPRPVTGRRVSRVERATITPLFPYPIAPVVVIASGDTSALMGRPARLPGPALDEGPHLNYAIQWFAFAVISVIGTAWWVYVQRRPKTAP